jgi:rhamnosyltransferase
VLIGEDSIVVARMLLAGWKVVYQADASVFHSHPHNLWHEVSRYFDIGAYHAREDWMLKAFGNANSEGIHFLKSEMRYLLSNAPHLLPLALLRTATKLASYRLGSMHRHLPTALKQKLSDYPQFWANNR